MGTGAVSQATLPHHRGHGRVPGPRQRDAVLLPAGDAPPDDPARPGHRAGRAAATADQVPWQRRERRVPDLRGEPRHRAGAHRRHRRRAEADPPAPRQPGARPGDPRERHGQHDHPRPRYRRARCARARRAAAAAVRGEYGARALAGAVRRQPGGLQRRARPGRRPADRVLDRQQRADADRRDLQPRLPRPAAGVLGADHRGLEPHPDPLRGEFPGRGALLVGRDRQGGRQARRGPGGQDRGRLLPPGRRGRGVVGRPSGSGDRPVQGHGPRELLQAEHRARQGGEGRLGPVHRHGGAARVDRGNWRLGRGREVQLRQEGPDPDRREARQPADERAGDGTSQHLPPGHAQGTGALPA